MNEQQNWQDWLTALVGLWILITPWAIPFLVPGTTMSDGAAWSHYIVGLALIVVGLAAVTNYRLWEEWVDVILGVWLVISPWVMGFARSPVLTWNAVVMGIIVILLAGSVLYTRPTIGAAPR